VYYYTVKAYKTTTKGNVYTSYNSAGAQVITSYPYALRCYGSFKRNNSINISWTKVMGAAGYYVYRRNSTTESWSKIATVNGVNSLSYNNTGLTEGKAYYYTVKAFNNNKQGNIYSKFDKTGSTAKPGFSTAKTFVTPQKYNGGIEISWTKVVGAGGYVVYYKTSKDTD
jgi:fibronectin type 3 domain-containing protein